MSIHGHDDPLQSDEAVDVVIVGAGPGGGAASRQLARAGLKVVLVEEGPPRSRFRPSFTHTARYHMQEGGTLVVQGPVPFPVAAGRGVGGSSLVNSAICFRTPPDVLRGWTDLLGDERYSPEALGPIFDDLEARIEVVPVTEAIAGENNMIVARGVAKLGLGGGLMRRNTPGCVGCGICNFGCPSGGKASVDKNLIVDALADGARIQADCKVRGLIFEGGRVRGVHGVLHDPDTLAPVNPWSIRAKAVLLSAGAIGTPRMLWHDGLARRIGPVGDRLYLHPGSGIIGRCDHPVHMWKGATQGAYVLDPANPKVLPHTFNAPPEVFIVQSGRVGAEAKALLGEIKNLCGLGVMISDHGRGSVRASSQGRASLRYRFTDDDVEILRRGLVLAARVELAGGAREVSVTAFGARWHSTAESLAEEVAAMPLSAMHLYSAHPMSTCPMGRDPDESVVDSRGKAHRVEGLWIADASVFPTSLGVNPQLTTMAMGTVIGRALAEAVAG